MTRQYVRRNHESPQKSDDNWILQRSAVRELPAKTLTPQTKSPASTYTGIKLDLMEIPVSNYSAQPSQPKMRSHPPVQQLRTKGMQEAQGEGRRGEHQTPVQRQEEEKKAENKTGLPDRLKEGIESLSGFDLSGVRVNYNSPKPAQLNAHAYTQGQGIEVAPGQERHLPHEAWHVVQQKQGRVKPTMEVNGVGVNDNQGLEREADVMGEQAVQMRSRAMVQQQKEKGVESVSNAHTTRSGDHTIQRLLIIDGSPKSWAEVYLAHVYPMRNEIMQETGARENDITRLLKKYDQENVNFSNISKIIEVLKQELIIERQETSISDLEILTESEGDDLFEERDEELALIKDSVKGNKLYRSMRTDEIENAISSQKLEAIGSFFSPSLDYSLQYLKGEKAKGSQYDGFVEITLNMNVYEFYQNMLEKGLVHFQNAGKAKKLFTQNKTKKGAPYLLKLEGNVLNIQLVEGGDISELNNEIHSIKILNEKK
ncbi:hypothetical protein BJP34_16770 [Moorena producens PAL-8-15-08-1]|uniref:eCIS core domain-containing protein n=1 Tax=Moorena producens PAL-8-15-08-1 TaxID=1458985 RepID=A0A1D8TTB2_9CYAN|nr:DUF4157 domain-containing protein [Moorena producens]AOX00878.1 hypothetical protein BJP34_16770 [Moorena producens PAL-8-15-08-1]